MPGRLGRNRNGTSVETVMVMSEPGVRHGWAEHSTNISGFADSIPKSLKAKSATCFARFIPIAIVGERLNSLAPCLAAAVTANWAVEISCVVIASAITGKSRQRVAIRNSIVALPRSVFASISKSFPNLRLGAEFFHNRRFL